jgi:ABC-type nitrate/sulfonate/bicarbonate transport system permease component
LLTSSTNDFFSSLPTIVLFPLFMVIFGINDFSKVLVTIFGLFWIVLFNTTNSLQTVSQARIKYMQSLRADSLHIFQHYILFVLTKNWISNARICLNLALLITITLEMVIGSESGIGKQIIDAKNYYEINLMYFWIIVAGMLGYGLNLLVKIIETNFQINNS